MQQTLPKVLRCVCSTRLRARQELAFPLSCDFTDVSHLYLLFSPLELSTNISKWNYFVHSEKEYIGINFKTHV